MTDQKTPDRGLTAARNGMRASGAQRRQLVPTPALRGHPGGPGLPGQPLAQAAPGGNGAAAHQAESTARGNGAAARQAETTAETVWLRSQQLWQQAGVDWMRAPGWLPQGAWSNAAQRWLGAPQQTKPVGADWELTQPMPVIGTAGRGSRPRAGGTESRARPGRTPAQRGHRRRVAGSVIAGVAVLALAGTIITAVFITQPPRSQAKPAGPAGYPPAVTAASVFTPGRWIGHTGASQAGTSQAAAGQAGAGDTGIPPVLTALATSGDTAIVIGSQVAPAGRRTVILVSADAGATWQPALLRAPGGTVTSDAVPSLLAGGSGGWLALGPHASWLSVSGELWRQEPAITTRPGDRVLGLARSAAGFVAVGTNMRAAGRARGILWTSPDGIAWRRRAVAGLLPAGGQQLTALDQVAVSGNTMIVTGSLAAPGKDGQVPAAGRAWRSSDGGITWAQVRVTPGRRMAGTISGVARDHDGFVLVVAGRTAAGRPDTLAYRSAGGSNWRFAGKLTGPGRVALRVTSLAGSDNGAVVTATDQAGHGRPANVVLVAAGGRSWHREPLPGAAAHARLAAAAAAPGGVVLSAGSAVPGTAAGVAAPAGRRPFLLESGSRQAFVGQRTLAGAATAAVSVAAIASGAGQQVAVGKADGDPAIWTAPAGGRWSADPPGPWSSTGLTLSGITHGVAGWLAVGTLTRHRQTRPLALISRDGRTWQPAPGLRRLATAGTVITQAAGDGAGLVMVGQRPAGGRLVAMAWWSPTLGDWNQAADTAVTARRGRAPGSRRGHTVQRASQMLAVTAGGPGFVAVGASRNRPAVWSSRDGRVWRPALLPLPAGARSARLQRVAALGQRIVAVGSETTAAGSQAFAAASGDAGRTWQEFRLPVPACPAATGSAGGLDVTGITGVGGGFVAAGTCGAVGRQDVVVWSSVDGRTWTATAPHGTGLSGPGVQEITALTAAGNTLTGAGYTETPTGAYPTLWHVPAPLRLAAAAGRK